MRHTLAIFDPPVGASPVLFLGNKMESLTVELARKLIQLPSLNPPGQEKDCIAFLAHMLRDAGLDVRTYEFAPGRPSIVARATGSGNAKPLAFTGHVDVVPLGEKPWTVEPFVGDIRDGKLFGRGASDMKAGVAAFVAATLAHMKNGAELKRGITLVITAGKRRVARVPFILPDKAHSVPRISSLLLNQAPTCQSSRTRARCGCASPQRVRAPTRRCRNSAITRSTK